MQGRLRRWLWKGTIEPDLRRLEPLTEGVAGQDIIQSFSATLKEITQQLETARQTVERRRAAEQTGNPAPAAGSDAEAKQIARSMLPSLDALDRIIEFGEGHISRDEAFQNWLISIKGLRARLTKTLEGMGLSAMSAVGCEVNLEIHDVVSVVPAGKFPANTVVAEQQRGYYFKGKLLRDAKVVVAQ